VNFSHSGLPKPSLLTGRLGTFRFLALRSVGVWILMVFTTCFALPAAAQREFPPPQGKGRVVLVLSGMDGEGAYVEEARRIAGSGYNAVLIDSNKIPRDNASDVLRAYIHKALQSSHSLPGKVGIVGYSLGGGRALQAAHMADAVAVIVAWYPATTAIMNQAEFVKGLQVPTLMLAAEDDRQTISPASPIQCCAIATARTLAAMAAGRPLELASYPNTAHGFINGKFYNAPSYADASRRMTAKLEQYLR
jgi:hypothetical protein